MCSASIWDLPRVLSSLNWQFYLNLGALVGKRSKWLKQEKCYRKEHLQRGNISRMSSISFEDIFD